MNNLIKWDAVIDGIKEWFRIVYIAAYPIIIMGIDLQTKTIIIDWKLVLGAVIIATLKGVDEWVHEAGKNTKDKESKMIGGITRF